MFKQFTERFYQSLLVIPFLFLIGCGGLGSVKPVDSALMQSYEKGLSLMKAKKYQQAIDVFNGIIKKDADLAGPHINNGIAYRKLGKTEQARSELLLALKINPDSAIANNQLGVLHRNEGEFDKAKTAYSKSIAADKAYSSAYLNLGILCDLYLRDFSCAIDNYSKYQSLTGNKNKQVSIWVKDLQRRLKKK